MKYTYQILVRSVIGPTIYIMYEGCTCSSTEFVLLYSEFSAQFVQLLLVIGGHLGCTSEIFVVLLDRHLVVHALGLEHLHLQP